MTEKINNKYLKQDYKKPIYVFHGSRRAYDKLVPQQSRDAFLIKK